MSTSSSRCTIVSVTPIAVARDSRTLKMARSFAEWGYNSIVIEGEVSGKEFCGLGFTLISVGSDLVAGNIADQSTCEDSPDVQGDRLINRLRSKWRKIGAKIANGTRGSAMEILLAPLMLGIQLCHMVRRTGPAVARRIPKADLFYVHAFELWPAVALRRLFSGVPVVYDAHDLYMDILLDAEPDHFTRHYLSRISRIVETSLARNAEAIVTVSGGIARGIIREFGRAPVVVRNCHDSRLDMSVAEVPSIREYADIPKGNFLVAVVGNAKPAQAAEQLLTALKDVPDDVHVVFIGSGYERHSEHVRRTGVGSRVHMVGRLPARAVVPALRDADLGMVLYLPNSENYAFCLPNGFFQMLSAGLPLVYPSSTPEVAGLAREYSLGWECDPSSPESLYAALTAARDDPDARRLFQKNARRAAQELSWEQESKRLGSLLETLLA